MIVVAAAKVIQSDFLLQEVTFVIVPLCGAVCVCLILTFEANAAVVAVSSAVINYQAMHTIDAIK